MRWNACVYRVNLGLYSHPKEFWGNGIRTHVNSNGKTPSTEQNSPQRRIEPMSLHQVGQRTQHTVNELFRSPPGGNDTAGTMVFVYSPCLLACLFACLFLGCLAYQKYASGCRERNSLDYCCYTEAETADQACSELWYPNTAGSSTFSSDPLCPGI